MPRIETEPLRAHDLERIFGEQICAEILSEEALQRRVDDLLYEVDEMLQESELRKDSHWWQYADLRDDLIDVLRESRGSACNWFVLPIQRQYRQEKASHD